MQRLASHTQIGDLDTKETVCCIGGKVTHSTSQYIEMNDPLGSRFSSLYTFSIAQVSSRLGLLSFSKKSFIFKQLAFNPLSIYTGTLVLTSEQSLPRTLSGTCFLCISFDNIYLRFYFTIDGALLSAFRTTSMGFSSSSVATM